MTYEIIHKNSFPIIGVSLRTTNENGKAFQEIPAFWNQFYQNNIIEKISGKRSSAVYGVYTDYEKDHTKPYTLIIGCAVNDTAKLPEGMVKHIVPASLYAIFTAKGKLDQAIGGTWQKIWHSDIPRTYTADFELYDERAKNPDNVTVPIFISMQ